MGGLIGYSYNTVVTNCFAGGAVTNIRYRYVGGFAGEVSGGAFAGCARNAEAGVYGAIGANNTVDSEGRIAFPAFAFAPQMFFKLQAGLK